MAVGCHPDRLCERLDKFHVLRTNNGFQDVLTTEIANFLRCYRRLRQIAALKTLEQFVHRLVF